MDTAVIESHKGAWYVWAVWAGWADRVCVGVYDSYGQALAHVISEEYRLVGGD
jgi:hypothetical protein